MLMIRAAGFGKRMGIYASRLRGGFGGDAGPALAKIRRLAEIASVAEVLVVEVLARTVEAADKRKSPRPVGIL